MLIAVRADAINCVQSAVLVNTQTLLATVCHSFDMDVIFIIIVFIGICRLVLQLLRSHAGEPFLRNMAAKTIAAAILLLLLGDKLSVLFARQSKYTWEKKNQYFDKLSAELH